MRQSLKIVISQGFVIAYNEQSSVRIVNHNIPALKIRIHTPGTIITYVIVFGQRIKIAYFGHGVCCSTYVCDIQYTQSGTIVGKVKQVSVNKTIVVYWRSKTRVGGR